MSASRVLCTVDKLIFVTPQYLSAIMKTSSRPNSLDTSLILALVSTNIRTALGAWWSGGGSSNNDYSMYGSMLTQEWLSESKSISLKYEGCVFGFNHQEGDGCPENESEDGTTYWYQMANCVRPQAVFSLYASDGNSASCSSSNFKESFVTEYGFSEFIYLLASYDANGPFANFGNDDNYYGSDDYFTNNGGFDYDNFPTCEYTDYGYVGLGCSSSGDLILRKYNDEYCFDPVDDGTYDSMTNVNKALKTYKDCVSAGGGNNNNGDGDDGGTLASQSVGISNTCSPYDNPFCQNNDMSYAATVGSSKTSSVSKVHGVATRSWVTKLKYVAGGMLLVASFVMFTGILFTNRRRRRALMQRKYRQSKKSSSRSSGRSKSKDGDTKSRSTRSKSRNRESKNADSGVFT